MIGAHRGDHASRHRHTPGGHPHICVLYDIGKHEGAAYLVPEYLEGETWALACAAGRVPLDPDHKLDRAVKANDTQEIERPAHFSIRGPPGALFGIDQEAATLKVVPFG
jgi:hypothetical protein